MPYLIGAVGILGGIVILVLLSGIRYIPNTRIGIVEKRFSLSGSVKSGFIALNGEAGFQPKVLRGGLHYLPPLKYVVRMAPLGPFRKARSATSLRVTANCLSQRRRSPPTRK